MTKGWHHEPVRHGLARKGIKTGRKKNIAVKKNPVIKTLSDKLKEMPFEARIKDDYIQVKDRHGEWQDMMQVDEVKDKSIDEIQDDIDEYRYEADPQATVVYSDEEEYPHTITDWENDTDFDVKWVSTDAWRGYYDSYCPDKSWKKLHTDNILSYSADAEQLHQMDEELQEELKARGIKFARVFARSSNVFSSGYDFYVPTTYYDEVKGIAKKLAKQYRDPARYESTALTGKDPEDLTEEDKAFVTGAKLIRAGADPKTATAIAKIQLMMKKKKKS